MAQDVKQNPITSELEDFTGIRHVDIAMNNASSNPQTWVYTDLSSGSGGDVVREVPKLVRDTP
jgi:hypothetical protein